MALSTLSDQFSARQHWRGVLGVFVMAILLGAVCVALGMAVTGGKIALTEMAMIAVGLFGLQWLGVLHAALTGAGERYFDAVGAASFLAVVWSVYALAADDGVLPLLVTLLVTLWAARLGSFLLNRILRDGHDRRFDQLRDDPVRFTLAWTVQAVWVWLTLLCVFAIITTPAAQVSLWTAVGSGLWLLGFCIETVADAQKRQFRRHSPDRFIHTGLWALCRHPNYAGEILLWCGIALISVPMLSGLQWVALISPVWVYVLLTRISGIPLLDEDNQRRFGDDPAYQSYRRKTPALCPRLGQ
ncbi:DUF1295 domain-containing protein [Aestuariibacter halophilus]|uniref:DUF1295 domain-containing protein n=1 Tax=Fluctibacter halophilus TaxID=226011 RepID=A0ABS8GAT2_9ALTE|nr:DUF1295 domain-containing protein [Aestuariibacter halophilus]MCC2617675.1 DUF1295 domain-containing protein [Aestuariibacter halophilus]